MSEPETALHRFAHEAMATIFEVVIAGEKAKYARQAAGAVFRKIDELEVLLSRFEESSDITRVNRLKPGQSIPVSLEVFECLKVAEAAYRVTGGAFDVTVGALMDAFRKGGEVPEKDRSEDLAQTGMQRLVFVEEGFSIGVADDGRGVGVKVDLGGIGKGYALDKAALILEDWGIESALIHGGTSTALAIGGGDPALEGRRKGWLVGAGGDWGEGTGLDRIVICNEALSGSGTAVRGQHILDPRTGLPAEAHLGAWSIAPSATWADALSTAFMIMPLDQIRECCRILPETGALVVDSGSGPESRTEQVAAIGSFAEHGIG